MAHSIPIKNGIITLVETEFNCPICTISHDEGFYYKQLSNSKRGFIYKKCSGCGEVLGITSDIKGDVVVWLKNEEPKQKIV